MTNPEHSAGFVEFLREMATKEDLIREFDRLRGTNLATTTAARGYKYRDCADLYERLPES